VRQTRIGLPWEKPLTTAEFLHSFRVRTGEMLPIDGGFEQPVFVLGLAAVLGAFVLGRRRLRPGPETTPFRSSSRPPSASRSGSCSASTRRNPRVT
jgi:hypothetical protein